MTQEFSILKFCCYDKLPFCYFDALAIVSVFPAFYSVHFALSFHSLPSSFYLPLPPLFLPHSFTFIKSILSISHYHTITWYTCKYVHNW